VVQPGRGAGREVLRPGAHRAVAVLCSRDEAVTRARALLHLEGGGGIHVFGCDGRLAAVEQVDTTARRPYRPTGRTADAAVPLAHVGSEV